MKRQETALNSMFPGVFIISVKDYLISRKYQMA